MYRYFIYYFGLIAHLPNDGSAAKDYAAMVRDYHHIPVVVFDHNRGRELNAATTDIEFRISGTITESHAFTDRHFDSFVPSIQQVMGGTLLPRSRVARKAIIIHYPATADKDGDSKAGTLSVGELYENVGRHQLGGNVRRGFSCVARLTVLAIEIPADELEIVARYDGSEDSVGKLKPGECVIIGNVSKDAKPYLFTRRSDRPAVKEEHQSRKADKNPSSHLQAAAQMGPGHFKKYARLLSGENDLVTVFESDTDCPQKGVFHAECPWVEDFIDWLKFNRVTTPTHLECGNSAYP